MPELPEVEHAVVLLRPALVGRTITRVRTHHPAYARRLSARARRSLIDARVTAVTRRGKYQFITLADGRVLCAHFRMTGRWMIGRSSDPLPRFARCSIDLDDGTRAVLDDARALGSLELVLAGTAGEASLGPEPTDPALTPLALRRALATRRASIKSALLDQRVIAGLGNIYVAEALWRARIDPRTSAALLTGAKATILLRAIRTVLRRATGARYTERGAARLDVYDRENDPCRRCGSAIARIVQTGRSTYFCPTCQRNGATAPAGARP
jgi:formamidopyrimidine-DNA glycosylase